MPPLPRAPMAIKDLAVDQEGADELFKAFIEPGIHFFDTAGVYSDGES